MSPVTLDDNSASICQVTIEDNMQLEFVSLRSEMHIFIASGLFNVH